MRRSHVFVSSLLALLPIAAQAEPAALSASVALSHPQVLAGKVADVYLMLTLEGVGDAAAPAARPPLNLALVVDRSGSMAEPTDSLNARTKMSYAIAAAQRFVEGLQDQDSIAVVEYDDRVTVMLPASPATAAQRAGLRTRLAALSPRGATDLAGGLLRGGEEIAARVRPGAVTRVVLMSDGLANRGVTDERAIGARVRALLGRGVRASAVGLGLDYNENLMQLVAESGGGRYYYVESPTQLAAILEEELKLAASAVVSDLTVAFASAGPQGKAEILGYENRAVDGRVEVTQHDLGRGEKRAVLVKLVLGALSEGEHALGELVVHYRDLAAKQARELRLPVKLTAGSDAAEVTRAQNNAVLAEATLVEAARSYAAAVEQYEQGDKEGAIANIGSLANSLGQANASLNDVRLRKKIEGLGLERGRMERADQSQAARQVYLKSSKMTARGTGKGMTTSGLRGSDILMEGARGFEVERLERALVGVKLFAGPVDGLFDAELTVAVRAYQAREGLEVDGIAGPATLSRLGLY